MKIRDFPLLTDENLSPRVVELLRREGFDVSDVTENHWQGEGDDQLLVRALAEGRAIVSRDGDFGTLAIRDGRPFAGIVRLRPGHIAPHESIAMLGELLAVDPDLQYRFLVVVKLAGSEIGIRVRQMSP